MHPLLICPPLLSLFPSPPIPAFQDHLPNKLKSLPQALLLWEPKLNSKSVGLLTLEKGLGGPQAESLLQVET